MAEHCIVANVVDYLEKTKSFSVAVTEVAGDARTNKIRKSELISINISGQLFLISTELINRFPTGRLADKADRAAGFREEINAVFYDRDPHLFNAILNVYRYGWLSIPSHFDPQLVQAEIDFWGLPIDVEKLSSSSQEQELLDAEFEYWEDNCEPLPADASSWRKFCFFLWNFYTDPLGPYNPYPKSGTFAAGIIILTSYLYMLLFGLTTSKEYRMLRVKNSTMVSLDCELKIDCFVLTEEVEWLSRAIIIVRTVCIFETFTRLIISPNKKRYFTSVINWIDIMASLAAIGSLLSRSSEWGGINRNIAYTMVALDALQALRLFRVFQFMKLLDGLMVMMLTLKASLKELFVLLMYTLLGMFFFSTAIVLAEFNQSPDIGIGDCLIGYWWAVVTMSTVGYGDYYPGSFGGYVVGMVTALAGLLLTALPVAVVGNNFTRYWTYMKIRKERRRQPAKEMSKVLVEKNAGGTKITPIQDKTTIADVKP